MYPPDAVVRGDWPHALWQVIGLGHDKVVKHRDDVALGLEGAGHLLVDPVLLLVVVLAPVHGAGRADEDEVSGRADRLEEVVVELAGLQAGHVEKHGVVPQLQVDLHGAIICWSKISLFFCKIQFGRFFGGPVGV